MLLICGLNDALADPFGYLGHDGVSESSKSVHPMWDVRRYAGDVQPFPPHRFMAFRRPISDKHAREQVL